MSGYQAHPTATVDDGAVIGHGVRIWHYSHVMSGAVIGAGCNIGQNVMIASGAVLGRNVKVQNNVSVYAGVECGDDVFLGPSCVFTNVRNPRSAVDRKSEFRPTVLGRGATIGANATVICGHTIGAYAFVAAGAVVNCDVAPYAYVAGSPAEWKGWVSEYGHRLLFDASGRGVCPESGQEYRLSGNKVERIS